MACNVKELQDFVRKHWRSDFDVEVSCKEMPTKILFFDVDHYENYWEYNPPKWNFGGKRIITYPVEDYPESRGFFKRLEKHGLKEGTVVNLDQALRLVEIVFSSKRTKYSEIEKLLKEE